jgi:beta-ketodecanoyl-[acyl-carrier-protein] synthase
MSTGSAITGSGVFVPENVVSNEELCAAFNAWVRKENTRRADDIEAGRTEALPESSPAFIEKVSGIVRRHYADKRGVLDPNRLTPHIPDRADDTVSLQAEWAASAARSALAAAGRHGEDVDLVIVAASSLQRPYPALAIEVQHEVHARGFAYDVSVGCSSAGYALQQASEAIRAGSAHCALVCAPEIPSAYCNFHDRDSHFILGDAAAAVVVEPLDGAKPGAFELVSSVCVSSYSSNVRNNQGFLNRCDADRRDHPDKLFYQQGRRVFRDIVQLVPSVVRSHLAQHQLGSDDVSRYWLHQANGSMNASVMRRLLGREPGEVEAPMVLSEYGNTAAAGALLAFDRHHDDLPSGAFGVLCSFGAGYTVSSQLLRRI